MTGFLTAAALASRARRMLRCLLPGRTARIEREWRDVHGMPRDHPESFTRPLSRRQEKRLAALAAELWPDDEYEVEL